MAALAKQARKRERALEARLWAKGIALIIASLIVSVTAWISVANLITGIPLAYVPNGVWEYFTGTGKMLGVIAAAMALASLVAGALTWASGIVWARVAVVTALIAVGFFNIYYPRGIERPPEVTVFLWVIALLFGLLTAFGALVFSLWYAGGLKGLSDFFGPGSVSLSSSSAEVKDAPQPPPQSGS